MNQAFYTLTRENSKAEYANYISSKLGQNYKLPLLLILLHIPLGIVLYNAGSLALIHPFVVFLIGMRHAVIVGEKLERVALIAAYIVGAEILWRMAGVPIFWEFGKYATAVIMITALVRRGLWKMPALAIFYFVLLLPSCLITLSENNFNRAKDTISFNLSGPFLLFISCWFFSHLKLNSSQIKKLLLALIITLMSVAVTTLFYTVTATEIAFTGESNFATSGGFGPNQVSSMLGLGLFLSVACLLLFKNSINYIFFFGILAVVFATQTMMTFSRGGVYTAVAGILLIVIFQMRDIREGFRRLLPILAMTAVFMFVIFPYLDDFTGGALQDRFEDTDLTRRDDIVWSDIQLFADNPFLGVGLGNAFAARATYLDYRAASHTEFARLISEHGIFGILALGVLALMIILNFQKQDSNFGKALVIGFVGWSSLFMLNAGMRLAAPAFIWGIIYVFVINFAAYKPISPAAERLKNRG